MFYNLVLIVLQTSLYVQEKEAHSSCTDIYRLIKGSIFRAVVTCTRMIRKYFRSARSGFAELSCMACMFDYNNKTTAEASQQC